MRSMRTQLPRYTKLDLSCSRSPLISSQDEHDEAHLDGALLGLVLGAGQARAPDDGEPVLDELLDQREVAVVQQLQQVALQVCQALAPLRAGRLNSIRTLLRCIQDAFITRRVEWKLRFRSGAVSVLSRTVCSVGEWIVHNMKDLLDLPFEQSLSVFNCFVCKL